MSMSKKNYEAVAAILRPHVEYVTAICSHSANELNSDLTKIVVSLVNDLAIAFKADNSRFQYDRFFEACGLDAFGEIKVPAAAKEVKP